MAKKQIAQAQEHSKMFEKIKAWYESGAWSREWVLNAVSKGKITQTEADEILGEA